jgi:drug/metabolite transporter (DMT)-like permease
MPRTGANALPILTFLLLIGGSVCAASGTLLLKAGANGRTALIEFVNLWVIAGLALYMVGSGLWILAMAKEPLSVVYPFTALSFVLVLGGAIVFQGERPALVNLIGIGVVMVGIALVVWGRQ